MKNISFAMQDAESGGELCSQTGGVDKYAWWKTSHGEELFENSVLLLKKEQL